MTRKTRALASLVVALVLSLSTAGSAFAAWTSLAAGTGSAAAGTMPAGQTPTGIRSGSDVVISWGAAQLAGGAEPSYVVTRYAGATASTPGTGCSGVRITTQCTEAGTPEGRWSYAVTVAKGNWRGDESSPSASVHVPTLAPTEVAASSASRTSVTLTWTDNSQIEDGYRLQWLDGSTWTNTGGLLSSGATSGADTTITCGVTRRYRVVAQSAANGDAESTELEATASACPRAEAQPTNLTATTVSTTRIDLAWTDGATSETGYLVESSVDGAIWTTLATLNANSTNYSDTTLACGVTRHYRVIATGEVNSNPSNTATATASVCAGPPAAPSNLAGQGVSATTIALTWTDNATNETGFIVERANNTNFTGGVTTFSVSANATSYQDTTAGPCATTRHYRVRATNLVGTSGNSNEVSVATVVCPPASAPTITVSPSGNTLNVGWAAIAGATSYKIERQNGSTWEEIATTSGTSYADALSCNQTRSYRVRASNAGGDSAYSNVASGTTQACAPATAPTLTATVTGYTASLSWTAVAGAGGYKVERQNGAAWDLVSTTTGTSATDTLPCTQSRTYRVRAYNVGGDGPNSDTKSPTGGACPKPKTVELVPSSGRNDPAGVINTGDQVVVTYDSTAAISVSSFCSTWTNNTNAQTLNANGDVTVSVSAADVLTVASGTCSFKFGEVGLAADYVTTAATFKGSNSSKSVIAWDPATKKLTITFGALSSGTLAASAASVSTATYTASSDLRDVNGNAVDTTGISTTNQRF